MECTGNNRKEESKNNIKWKKGLKRKEKEEMKERKDERE